METEFASLQPPSDKIDRTCKNRFRGVGHVACLETVVLIRVISILVRVWYLISGLGGETKSMSFLPSGAFATRFRPSLKQVGSTKPWAASLFERMLLNPILRLNTSLWRRFQPPTSNLQSLRSKDSVPALNGGR